MDGLLTANELREAAAKEAERKAMAAANLRRRIDAIPGADGWEKAGTRDDFHKYGRYLVEYGHHPDFVVELLRTLYDATAREFGN